MKPEWKKFAPISLYIGLLAALVAAGFFIVQGGFELGAQISLAVFVIGLALFVILDPEKVRSALTGRQARYGSNSLLLAVAFLGIVVVLNYFAFKNSPRWDLTEDKTHTLAPETIEMLNKLPEPVQAQAFFTRRISTENARTLLENFKANSSEKFDYVFIDPEADPVRAEGITRDGTIVFVMGDRREQVTFANETEFTSVLLRLSNPGERKVYFLTGHGEFDPTQSGDTSYGDLRSALTKKNYQVETLSLISVPAVPEDALAIIVAGPQQPVSEQESQVLAAYLTGGGSLIYLAEPDVLNENGPKPDPLADYLAASWGINLGTDLIVDPTINPPVIAAVNQYGTHPITERMQGLAALFPTARSISTGTVPETITLTTLASTSPYAWGETDLASLQNDQVANDENDISGPVTLAVAGDDPTTQSRVVVIGDSDFASNAYFKNYGNGDFLVNAIDWAAEQENLLNITPKTPTQRFLIPPQRYVMALLALGLICGLPGLVILGGVVTWIQRKRRG